jgi:coatomer subunit beta'
MVEPMPCSVKTCKWVGDCFIYTNSTNRLNYLVGDQSHTLNHFDQYVHEFVMVRLG